MRSTTFGMVVCGVVLAATAGWLSWVVPLRSESQSGSKRGIMVTITTKSNIWGKGLWQSMHSVMGPDATNENGEPVPEGESIYEGPLDGKPGMESGTWTYRQRPKGGEWVVVDKLSGKAY